MKKEIILSVYLNIGNMDSSHVDEFMKLTSDRIKIDSEQLKVHWLIIPVRHETTRIECVYPSYIITDGQEHISELTELNTLLKQASENLFNKSE